MPTKKERAQKVIEGGLELALSALKPDAKNDVEFLTDYLTEIFEDALNDVITNKDKFKNLKLTFGIKGEIK